MLHDGRPNQWTTSGRIGHITPFVWGVLNAAEWEKISVAPMGELAT